MFPYDRLHYILREWGAWNIVLHTNLHPALKLELLLIHLNWQDWKKSHPFIFAKFHQSFPFLTLVTGVDLWLSDLGSVQPVLRPQACPDHLDSHQSPVTRHQSPVNNHCIVVTVCPSEIGCDANLSQFFSILSQLRGKIASAKICFRNKIYEMASEAKWISDD